VVNSATGFRPIVVNHTRKVGMSRALALLGTLATVVLVAAGCGGGGKSKSSSEGAGTISVSGGIKVGLVTDVGGLNDRGFNHLAYVGVQQAKQRLGASYR